MTSTTPSVTFIISSSISCFPLVLGIPPTNNLQLSTDMQTPINLPYQGDVKYLLVKYPAIALRMSWFQCLRKLGKFMSLG
jgi:hypothetical protein